MQLYECDICKKTTTEPLRVRITFERTPEEIKELMAAQDMPLGSEHIIKQASMVNKHLDFCRKCYDKFVETYNK